MSLALSPIAATPLEAGTGTLKSAQPRRANRIPALDFTKGALVLIMVLYHWINYFIGPEWPYYRYLRFLTPSFILVTGFLISNVYLSQYSVFDPRLPRRLLTRGLKLLAIFITLNIARFMVITKLAYGGASVCQLDLRSLAAIYITGNVVTGTGKAVAFYILVPISYLLLLSAAILFPYRSYRYTFHTVCIFFLCFILALRLWGFESPNLEFVTIGLLGILAGFIPIQRVNDCVGHPYVIAFAYILYLIAITIWNVPFLLLIVGAFLSVGGIYLLGLTGDNPGRPRTHVILLGKYSLLGYIGQIAILQLLSVGLRHSILSHVILGICFVAAFALTMISVEAVDRIRANWILADRLYKIVFA